MSRFNYQGLIFCKFFEIFLDKSVLKPVLTYLSCFTVGYQLIRIKGNFEIKVVIHHYLECFACQAFALIFVDRLAVDSAFRSVSVSINSAAGRKLFHEFRSQLFVKLFRYIS